MSLDIAFLGADGSPLREVRMPADAHARLMLLADGLELLGRLEDYYADAAYSAAEVAMLVNELQELLSLAEGSPDLRSLVEELASLAQHAADNGSAIVAIAD